MLQELVMDVLVIGGEDGASADEAADNRESRFKNRQSERDDGDGYGNDRGSLLRTIEGEGTEQEPDKQAAGITQEDGCRIEVVTQKSEDGARQSYGHDFD